MIHIRDIMVVLLSTSDLDITADRADRNKGRKSTVREFAKDVPRCPNDPDVRKGVAGTSPGAARIRLPRKNSHPERSPSMRLPKAMLTTMLAAITLAAGFAPSAHAADDANVRVLSWN